MTSLPSMTVSEALGSMPDMIDHTLGRRVLMRCLSNAGLPEYIPTGSGYYVPAGALNRLLETAARSAGDDLFGLYLSDKLSVAEYGAWGQFVLEADTLGQALERATQIIHLHANADALHLRVGPVSTRFEYKFGERSGQGYRQVAFAALGPMLSVPHHFLGNRWRPISIGLDLMRTEQDSRIETRLGTELRLEEDCISFEILNTDLATRNPCTFSFWTTRDDVLRECNGGPPREFVPFLQQLIIQRLGSNCTTLDDIASTLDTSRRALQRRLDQEGTNFREISVSARMQRATELLVDSPMPISEISASLDYSTPSHFARVFRKTFGKAPNEYRSTKAVVH